MRVPTNSLRIIDYINAKSLLTFNCRVAVLDRGFSPLDPNRLIYDEI